MQTHLRTRAPSSSPGYQPHPSWRWSPPQEGRQRTPLWSLSHGRALLVTSLISQQVIGVFISLASNMSTSLQIKVTGNTCSLQVDNSYFLHGELARGRAEGVSFRFLCVFHAPRTRPEQVLRGKLSLPTPPGGQESAAPWALPARRVWWFEPAPDQAAS